MGSRRKVKVQVKNIKAEAGADELVKSSKMKPYIALLSAQMQKDGEASSRALTTLADLKLEDRYLWRVASALKWAFVDFDSSTIGADMLTMKSEDDRKRVVELIRFRPYQFCLLMKAVLGSKGMEEIMLASIAHAKQSESFDPVTDSLAAASGAKPIEIPALRFGHASATDIASESPTET
jgi:hypothetical protein